MNEIADYIVNGLKLHALKLCDYNKVHADDLVQETALRVIPFFKRNPSIEFDRQKKICWVAMQRCCYTMWRKKQLFLANDIEYYSGSTNPVEAKEDSTLMRYVANNMKPFYNLLQGYSYKEISLITNKSVTAVHLSIHRAKKELRNKFKVA